MLEIRPNSKLSVVEVETDVPVVAVVEVEDMELEEGVEPSTEGKMRGPATFVENSVI